MSAACAIAAYNAQAQSRGWSTHADASLSFVDPHLQRFLDLWLSLATDGLPTRAAFTHRLLKDFLTDLVLVQRVAGGDWRTRLVGSRVADIYGDYTGRVTAEVLPQEDAARIQAAFELPRLAARPVRIIGRTDVANKDFFSAEYCLVPLRDEMVLSCTRFSAVPWDDYLPAMLTRLAEPLAVNA